MRPPRRAQLVEVVQRRNLKKMNVKMVTRVQLVWEEKMPVLRLVILMEMMEVMESWMSALEGC